MSRWVQASLMIVALIIGLGAVGCGDDLYGQCSVQDFDQCTDDEESDDRVSCVLDEAPECQTGTCARYESSEPYCTIGCETDGDCPGGECREIVFASGQRYCVAERDL